MSQQVFHFQAKIWLTQGQGAWHMLTLPQTTAEEIEFFHGHHKFGWGSLPIKATIGHTTWQTSIFTDKSSNSFILPLKKAIRLQENLHAGDQVSVTLQILVS